MDNPVIQRCGRLSTYPASAAATGEAISAPFGYTEYTPATASPTSGQGQNFVRAIPLKASPPRRAPPPSRPQSSPACDRYGLVLCSAFQTVPASWRPRISALNGNQIGR